MIDWRPGADTRALVARARLNQTVRQFFQQRGVLEVETPFLAAHGVTDRHIQCIDVPGYGYLQSSPEYHMKRLLAAGSGPIYQIARVFRDGEAGRRHNPEFSLLEWYRPGWSLELLIGECEDLLRTLLPVANVRRVAFRTLFFEATGLDPLNAPLAELQARAQADSELPELPREELVDYLMATVVEASLPTDQLTVVDAFPGWAAALARTETDTAGDTVARRFEIYFGGYELANGYDELTSAGEQSVRFAEDQLWRLEQGRPPMQADPWLLAALTHGLPDSVGVAMGLDRILMCQLQCDDIRSVLTFDHSRA